jgi:hypothetical protein
MLNINSRLDGKLQWNVFASLYTAKKKYGIFISLIGCCRSHSTRGDWIFLNTM